MKRTVRPLPSRSKPIAIALATLTSVTVVSCATPQPKGETNLAKDGSKRLNADEAAFPRCLRCQARIGSRLGEPVPSSPLAGEQRLQAFLTELSSSPTDPRSLGLTVVVGTADQLANSSSANPQEALAMQRTRVRRYLADLREESVSEDELRKQLLAWALCVCPRVRRCQGGDQECVRCSTCRTMSASHGSSRRKPPAEGGPGAWPPPQPTSSPDMGLMAADCPPKNVCLVVDVSGSMAEEDKLERIKAAVKESLRHYMAGDIFSLIAFNERSRLVIPPTQLEPAGGDLDGMRGSVLPRLMSSPLSVEDLVTGSTPMERTLRRFIGAIDGLYPGGQTDVEEALQLAAQTLQATDGQRLLSEDPRAINRVLLFSDGMHNAKRADTTVLKRFHARVHDLVDRRISISTFGVGRAGFDERLLAELVRPALEHSGRYYYVRDLAQVRELLWDDLMNTPMLKDAFLTVEIPAGVATLRFDPFTKLEGQPTTLRLNVGTLTAEEKRTVALRLRLQAGTKGELPVRLEYTDPGGHRRVETKRLSITEARARTDPASRVALEELALQRMRQAFGQAVALLDRGDRVGAARELEQALTALDSLD